MSNKIYPCLWMNGTAKEAANYYCKVFPDTTIVDENPMVVVIHSSGQQFMFLNGGPKFQVNPSISFYVHLTDEQEVNDIWQPLAAEGEILMPLDAYDWSQRYGWVKDKYGINWQISLGNPGDVPQKFSPFFTFTGDQYGRTEEAVRFYTSVFPDSAVTGILKHKVDPALENETVLHAQFILCGQVFMAIDSGEPHGFSFDEGVSLVISCQSQQKIDYFWEKLTEGGAESMCGWLKDKFGVMWQVVPANIGELMRDPAKSGKVMEAIWKMKKIDMELLMGL